MLPFTSWNTGITLVVVGQGGSFLHGPLWWGVDMFRYRVQGIEKVTGRVWVRVVVAGSPRAAIRLVERSGVRFNLGRRFSVVRAA